MSDQVAPKCYIYIYIHTQNSIFGGLKNQWFWIGFWIGFGDVFGEVLERFLEIILISLSYFFAYHVGKDLGRDLEGIWTDFEMLFDWFLNDFKPMSRRMRSLCQEECEADVKIILRFCDAPQVIAQRCRLKP